jgi:hypothetical protein
MRAVTVWIGAWRRSSSELPLRLETLGIHRKHLYVPDAFTVLKE